MNIQQIDPTDRKQVKEFLTLPFHIYHNNPQWVPPLQNDERSRLDIYRYPFYKHSKAAFFLADNKGRTIGRLAILDHFLFNQHNHEQTAFFYLFECENNKEAATGLFTKGIEWAKMRGLNRIMGPKGFTAMDGMEIGRAHV
jgi:hypothetical protein